MGECGERRARVIQARLGESAERRDARLFVEAGFITQAQADLMLRVLAKPPVVRLPRRPLRGSAIGLRAAR